VHDICGVYDRLGMGEFAEMKTTTGHGLSDPLMRVGMKL
jgi:hypothetical protein